MERAPNETSSGDEMPQEGDWTEALRFWLRFALEGVLVAVVANCGIFGNVVSAFILLRRRLDLQPFLCRLLVLLVVFDTVFLAADFLTYSLPMLSQAYAERLNPLLAPKFLIPLTQVALTGSVYTTVAVTVERYVSCCWPLVPQREGVRTSAAAIAAIVTFSFAFNITRFFEYSSGKSPVVLRDDLSIEDLPEELQLEIRQIQATKPLEIIPTDLRENPLYIRYYFMVANWTVMVFLPLISLIILNWKIHKAIQNREQFRATLTQAPPVSSHSMRRPSTVANYEKATKEREVTIGQILAIIVITFVVCQSFKVIVVGYEAITHFKQSREDEDNVGEDGGGYPLWVEVVINLNHVALAFNAAINIVIYICKDKTFRKACADLLPECLKKGFSSMQKLLQPNRGNQSSSSVPLTTNKGETNQGHSNHNGTPPKIKVTLAVAEQKVRLLTEEEEVEDVDLEDEEKTEESGRVPLKNSTSRVKGACQV